MKNVKPKADAAAGPTYEDCRTFDLRTQWLRRIWRFFGDKFDQRRSGEAAEVLAAEARCPRGRRPPGRGGRGAAGANDGGLFGTMPGGMPEFGGMPGLIGLAGGMPGIPNGFC